MPLSATYLSSLTSIWSWAYRRSWWCSGQIYHWYPKITGRMLNDTLGRIHFWLTFLGTYAIYLPMHYLGILGVPRRYYAFGGTEFLPGLGPVGE